MKTLAVKMHKFEQKYSLKIVGVAIILLSLLLPLTFPVLSVPPAPMTLDPRTIPKYVNKLTGPPPVYVPEYTSLTGEEYFTVTMTAFPQWVLPQFDALGNPTGFGQTHVWGYGSLTTAGTISNQPGPSFEANRGVPIYVRYQNKITDRHMFPVDPTLHWANPNGIPMFMPTTPANPFPLYPPGFDGTQEYPTGKWYDAQSDVPLIPHLHGAEVQSTSDGHPEAWFTASGLQGPAYNTELTTWWDGITPIENWETVFYYPNAQPPTTLWYHDHGLGITRINVMSGLAGFYLLRDPLDTIESTMLPTGKWEMPLVIQDRTFKITDPTTGLTDFWFPEVGLDPLVHPYWQPEFFGDTIMVNGLVWPNMDVDKGQYRLRLLDGSNARFYTITFLDRVTGLKLPFIQIGTDGGYLQNAALLTELTIAPGERADILIDFTGLPTGRTIQMLNSAKAPSPSGAPPDPQTVGQIMQFTVTGTTGFPPVINPANLPPLNPDLQTLPVNIWPTLPTPTAVPPQRPLVLWEVMGALGPTEILLNGQKWGADISENPVFGEIEEWVIVNPTADTHPIHLHLVQFQLVSRQKINMKKYVADWLLANAAGSLNGMPPWDNTYPVIPVDPFALNVNGKDLYLMGKPTLPATNEMGWKDTIQTNPGEVTVVRVRFAPIDGADSYPFDPMVDPGYVWHCHILDHEDNEMMRPYKVVLPTLP